MQGFATLQFLPAIFIFWLFMVSFPAPRVLLLPGSAMESESEAENHHQLMDSGLELRKELETVL